MCKFAEKSMAETTSRHSWTIDLLFAALCMQSLILSRITGIREIFMYVHWYCFLCPCRLKLLIYYLHFNKFY